MCSGAVQGVITERQDSERSLHAVGEGASGAVPGEPGRQLTKILHTHTERSVVHQCLAFL